MATAGRVSGGAPAVVAPGRTFGYQGLKSGVEWGGWAEVSGVEELPESVAFGVLRQYRPPLLVIVGGVLLVANDVGLLPLSVLGHGGITLMVTAQSRDDLFPPRRRLMVTLSLI
jgi:hypothetical protein